MQYAHTLDDERLTKYCRSSDTVQYLNYKGDNKTIRDRILLKASITSSKGWLRCFKYPNIHIPL